MKYTSRLINEPWEDPGVIVTFSDRRENWLFDCGDIYKLGVGTVINTTHVFVTHTHIDHFIGFDYLLRMNLRESKELKFFGPKGTADCIAAKLQGYTWNLTEDSKFIITCFDLPFEEGDKPVKYTFPANRRFQEDTEKRSEFECQNSQLTLYDGSVLRFAPVVHGLKCLCYSLTEPAAAKLNEAEFKKSGLKPGPWIKQLLNIYSQGADRSQLLSVSGKNIQASELEYLAAFPQPEKLAYITDTIFNRQSMKAMKETAENADVLWCEACYCHEELEKAKINMHMTARQTGRIASELKVKELRLFHYSRRYKGILKKHIDEASKNFENTAVPPQWEQ